VTDLGDRQPPGHWEADVVVADGGTVHLRPIRPADAAALVAFHAGLSARTRYLRYFSAYPRIPERDLHHFTHVDHHDRVALVAELAGQIIAVGRYERGSDNTAEVAFVVADAHQGRGIGSVLLEHLAAAARECGVERFRAVVLAENAAMIRVFRDAGYETTRHLESGEVTLTFDVAQTATTEAVMRDREQRAEARSIRRLLCPLSVAVVGASNNPDKVGHAVLANLVRMGFTGQVHPVHTSATAVLGRRAYRSVTDLPAGVGLVVVAVPAEAVPDVVRQCALRQIPGLVVLSGGFGERGDEAERADGEAVQREVVTVARAHGMRVVGPNCLGVVNTAGDIRLNASLAPLPPLAGRAGFFSQSGALGVAILGEAARRGLGVSSFVSAGNRADVSGNDLLQYWASDPNTDVVLMYLESFGNPRKFIRLARRLGREKPIVAVKSGTGDGAVPDAAARSAQLPDDAVRALFEASGVIRVDTLGDLFDVALLLTSQPLPPGDRLAVVGNSTALGVLAANAAAADGLRLTRLDDVGVTAGPAEFAAALRTALEDDAVDAIVAVFMPPLRRSGDELIAEAIRSAAAGSGKPVVCTYLGFDGVPGQLAASGAGAPPRGSVPSYPSPERAVRALARAWRHAKWRHRAPSRVPELSGIDLDGARALVQAVLAASPAGCELTDEQAARLLGCVAVVVSSTMPPDAVEVVLGIREDPSFGALASFGVGGLASELLGDRAYAAVPLTSADADELVLAPRAAPLLTGYRGAPPCDLTTLTDLALRLSALADGLPEVTDCRVHAYAAPVGTVVTSIHAAVAPASARPDSGPRRLRRL
jgi:acyl-CoA synthetase (NDP forming)/RimJ/RimL family protein N-acetyltransferase